MCELRTFKVSLVITEADPEKLARPTVASDQRERRSKESSSDSKCLFHRSDIDSISGMRSVPQWRQGIQNV